MKKVVWIFVVLFVALSFNVCWAWQDSLGNEQSKQDFHESPPTLRPDAYGPGIHSNSYGEAIELVPDGAFAPGETLKIKPDAYGPGIHMDQYGRPVREVPYR